MMISTLFKFGTMNFLRKSLWDCNFLNEINFHSLLRFLGLLIPQNTRQIITITTRVKEGTFAILQFPPSEDSLRP